MHTSRRGLTAVEAAILVLLVLVPVIALVALWRGPKDPPPSRPIARPPAAVASRAAARRPGAKPLKASWRTPVAGQLQVDQVANVHDDGERPFVALSVRPGHADLIALSPADGKLLWTVPFEGPRMEARIAAAVVEGTVVVLDGSGHIRAFARASGRAIGQWSGPTTLSPRVVGVDHTAITLGAPGFALQVDEHPLPGSFPVNDVHIRPCALAKPLPVIGGGRGVAITSDATTVHALDLETGDVIWQTVLRDAPQTALVRMKYVVCGGSAVSVLDRETGRLVGVVETGAPVHRLDERGSALYVMHAERRLTVLGLDTRLPLARTGDVEAFDYAMAGDFVMDGEGWVRLLGQAGEVIGQLSLERPPLPSRHARLRFNGASLVVGEVTEDGKNAVASYRM